MKRWPLFAGIGAVLAWAVSTAWLAGDLSEARTRLRYAEYRVDSLRRSLTVDDAIFRWRVETIIAAWQPNVDLHSESFQEIGGGFSVSSLRLSAAPGGVRVSGQILNETMVRREMAEFTLTTLGQSGSFTVKALPPGTAAPFSVMVVGVQADSVRMGSFRQGTSTLRYLRTGLGDP